MARGLAVAHERGLVHRDLKPDNIIVGPDLRPHLLDFGLALSLAEAGGPRRGFEGTPLYASPEQVRARPLTAASDVFSLGSLMFKVLTGRPPFAGETAILITPGYRFRAVDVLMTNFHLPRSTLFMLVCAFAGTERMRAAYDHAIATGYRFYSYGDACLLEPG